MLSSMLTSLKIEVDTAVDGKTAITLLEQAVQQGHPYDVVLLDWIMPGINGIETARRIKAHASLAKVPAMLMVTANGREEAYLEAKKAGLNAFLLKPVYASVMYNTLLESLGIQTTSGPRTFKKKIQTADLKQIQGAHILVVDDNSINREVATEFLEDVGMVVTVASNGQECLDALQHRTYDLVLMDIQMPVMDGLEVTRRIRQNNRFQDIPIIAMTAHAMAGDRDKSLAAGMNGHITKPIDQTVLYQTLKDWISEKQPGTLPPIPDRTNSVSRVDINSLPFLPGINQVEAFKALDQNKELFVKILYDFKKRYSDFPAILRELSVIGNWQEIQDKAHTIKGVSAYIGSSLLMRAAQNLEDALKNDQREDAASYLVSFINAFDEILSTLSVLPALQEEPLIQPNHNPMEVGWEKEVEDLVRVLIGQLRKGEVAAEEQFVNIEKILSYAGFNKQLKTIADLIDDIEYESAADMTEILLRSIQQQRES